MDMRVRFYSVMIAFMGFLQRVRRLVHPVQRFEPEIEGGAFSDMVPAVAHA